MWIEKMGGTIQKAVLLTLTGGLIAMLSGCMTHTKQVGEIFDARIARARASKAMLLDKIDKQVQQYLVPLTSELVAERPEVVSAYIRCRRANGKDARAACLESAFKYWGELATPVYMFMGKVNSDENCWDQVPPISEKIGDIYVEIMRTMRAAKGESFKLPEVESEYLDTFRWESCVRKTHNNNVLKRASEERESINRDSDEEVKRLEEDKIMAIADAQHRELQAWQNLSNTLNQINTSNQLKNIEYEQIRMRHDLENERSRTSQQPLSVPNR